MTVYEIAVGVFLALLVRDIVSLFAVEIARRIENKRYEKQFDELMDNYDIEVEEMRRARKKKAVKKKS